MKKKIIAVQPVQGLDARINITPLIDVVLVLLILFMVITPLAERELSVQLAAEKRTERPTEIVAEQILISVDGTGRLHIDADPVGRAEYLRRLQWLLSRRDPSARDVFVLAADGAQYADLVAAIDLAKQAGASRIGLAAEAEP